MERGNDKIFIRWDSIEGKLAYDDAAYLSLLKNFKERGYLEDYDYCYFVTTQLYDSLIGQTEGMKGIPANAS